MKNICNILAIALVAISPMLLSACSSDYDFDEKVSTVTVTSGTTYIPVMGGKASLQVTGEGIVATSSASWLSVSVSGNTINLEASGNTTKQSRNALVTVTASNGDKTYVNVSQVGMVVNLQAETNYTFEGSGNAEIIISDNSNVEFELSSDAWIHLVKTENGYKLTVDDNESNELRIGNATLTYGDVKQQIKIVQWGKVYPFLTMNTATYKDKDGNVQTKAVTIVANPSKEGQYLVQGLVPEGDLLLIPNTVDGHREWYVPCGHLVGTKNNLEGKQVWLRCMMSCKNIESDNRYIPTVKSEEPTTSYRMSFGWNIEEDGTVILPYQRNANLAEIYATDGIIVCRYTKANKVAKSDRDGDGDACIEYYFLDLKFSKV